ncbi:WXG100 family type VII secretion target [Amycolatopsis sp. 195334CR]|uniref:WXG100 family type VII secretion target n=1 Tax=Amycolatopsis sp. 195334CR TaxID=2814588 RepID=UPI001A8DD9D5|nr:WXG100 family type VII secretion target [Amycolatopsis sp. 195334CR]MBN6041750.1 WXG100 family type VII secretion target [Amycolatopsis sp. 195334CR]
MTAHTNFGSFSHQQLYAMLHAGDAGSARAAAEKWRAAGFGLFEQADNLMSQLTEFDGHWTGGAADKYKIMIDDLVGGIRKVGQTAVSMRHLLEDAADELDTAKAEMPPPVNVPEVSPADLSLAVNPPLLPADASPELMQAAAQRRATAIGNVEAQQQASNAANAAHSKAIQVMTNLAGDYTAAEESIPASPNAAAPPVLPPGSPGGGSSGGGAPVAPPPGGVSVVPGAPPTLPGDGTQPMPMPTDQGKPSSPLFGNMFTAGLAAASAAAFGRFGSIMPKVPPWAGGKKEGEEKPPGEGTGKLGDGFGGGGTGGGGGGVPIGGGSVGGLGGGGIGGVDVGGVGDGAAAAPGMAGSGSAAPGLSGLAGGAAGAAGAAAAKGMMPMMPFMPMGMGAGDMGSGRRIPPWLVETEDVWGESSVVAPSVIGEEPDAQR